MRRTGRHAIAGKRSFGLFGLTTSISTVVLLLAGCAGPANVRAGSSSSSAPSRSPHAPPGPGASPVPSPGNPAVGPYQLASPTPVVFVTDLIGWTESQPVNGSPAAIISTSDGGARWTRQYSGTISVRGFDFVSDSTGWAVGSNGLLTTTNGGQSWTPVGEPPSMLGEVAFSSPTHGLGVSDDNSLWVTSDAGTTWGKVVLPQPAESACASTGGSLDWAVGISTAYVSSDGGVAWKPAFTIPPGAPALTSGQNTVLCVGSTVLVSYDLGGGASSFHSLVVRSLDGGLNWVSAVGGVGSMGALHPDITDVPGPIALVKPETAYFSGVSAEGSLQLGKTIDGGTSLTESRVSPADFTGDVASVLGISFADPNHGWLMVATPSGTALLATSDGGNSWAEISQLPS